MAFCPKYYPFVSRCVAVLLLGAAALKLIGYQGVTQGELYFSRPAFVALQLELEVLLGLWLLSGKLPRAAWLMALATFLAFASVSLYLGSHGQPSCNCFGAISIKPWSAFGIDLAVLAALIGTRPVHPSSSYPSLGTTTLLSTVGAAMPAATGALVLILAFTAFAGFYFESASALLAFLRNERISASPASVDVGTGSRGDSITQLVEITNHTSNPLRIVGGTSDCSCIATQDLPVTVPPNGKRPLQLKFRHGGQPGLFARTAWLMTDDPVQRFVTIRIIGKLEESANP